MKFLTGSCTDIGTVREVNQDAVCIMQAQTCKGNVCMVIICDGMGGLSKGELASATLIKAFAKGFEEKLPELLETHSLEQIQKLWEKELLYWSDRLKDYGMNHQILLGTTFSGMLFVEEQYIWAHVGDSRIYEVNEFMVEQLTEDHTVIARELARGTMTPEEAEHSRLRNKLTQCIGASKELKPQLGSGLAQKGTSFLLCSDGLYHTISKDEMMEIQNNHYKTDDDLKKICYLTVKKAIERGEKDNISMIALTCI